MKNLAKYREMRDFSRTQEPRGNARGKALKGREPALAFVVQKHDARNLHYDFRLELDGVLLSWAVPKGPSLNPAVKRLAMEVEPHPLEYGNFEGTIPKGEYGGGTVMVWDRGSWKPDGDPKQALSKGHLAFSLYGEKLKGAWHLVRTKRLADDQHGNQEGKGWLLFKSRDEQANDDDTLLADQPDSVQSGRNLAQIADGKAPKSASQPRKKAKSRAKSSQDLPQEAEPELATLVDKAPAGDDWVHEIKLDGYRILARVEKGEVTLLTRNGKDWSERMPSLRHALEQLHVETALIDGELVALDSRGVSHFQTLQNSLRDGSDGALVYYAFDLLHLDGEDVTARPLLERKSLLRELLERSKLTPNGSVRFSAHVVGNGPAFFENACKLGLEGTIAKRATSPYRSGRGRDWLKIKSHKDQEFVIVGFTEPGGGRGHFGALLLASREGGVLTYAGKVGTGFSEATLKELHQRLKGLQRDESALTTPLRGAEARAVTWVEPKLVAEIGFTERTSDGRLRHPTFKGLRDDKPAKEVQREEPAPLVASKQDVAYRISNPDKVLYPELGITKQEVLEYYAAVAERILPHVGNRPLTLVRCPNGRDKACFFQKHPGQGTPPGLRSVSIREQEGKAPYSVIDDEQGLFGLVQLGALEIHTWGSRADDFEHPDVLVFDFDPDPSVEYQAVIAGALAVRDVFAQAKLETFVKTTGGKGLHVCVPIAPQLSWDQAKEFTAHVAKAMAARSPALYVATQAKAQRKGKTFIDYLRNGRGATFIAPYSTRARENAPIAIPLEWDELSPKLPPHHFNLRNVQQRLARLKKDPFARMTGLHQSLSALLNLPEG